MTRIVSHRAIDADLGRALLDAIEVDPRLINRLPASVADRVAEMYVTHPEGDHQDAGDWLDEVAS